jgi:hypothetical protein
VLELDLRVEQEAVVELVAEVDDAAQEVELVGAPFRGLVEHLAVAADRQPVAGAVDLRGRRPEAVLALVGPHRRLAQLDLLQLAGDHVDPALELVQAIGVGGGFGLLALLAHLPHLGAQGLELLAELLHLLLGGRGLALRRLGEAGHRQQQAGGQHERPEPPEPPALLFHLSSNVHVYSSRV